MGVAILSKPDVHEILEAMIRQAIQQGNTGKLVKASKEISKLFLVKRSMNS